MATTVLITIRDTLIRLLKDRYPAFTVTGEELPRTRGEGDKGDVEDYIFLDIIPTGNATWGTHQTERRVLIDIAVHTRSELNRDYLQMAQELDSVLRPVFWFEDGGEVRALTVPELSFRTVDKMLHCTFTLAFSDSDHERSGLPLMEDLVATTNIDERS